MIGLALLACHLLGEFVFQTRWQAERKLGDWEARASHVAGYSLPFAPVALIFGGLGRGLVFIVLLAALHFATDSKRFRSSLGDWVGWQFADDPTRRREWKASREVYGDGVAWRKKIDAVAPNPWTPLPLMVDQALHVAQLAVLGWLLV